MLECGLIDRIVLDRLELGLDGLHAAEQRGPGGGRVADMEVNVVQVLVSDHTGVKLLDHTGLQFVQKWFFGWFQFEDYLEASAILRP